MSSSNMLDEEIPLEIYNHRKNSISDYYGTTVPEIIKADVCCFCNGVKCAVQCAEKNAPAFTTGQLIHNSAECKRLEDIKVRPIEENEDLFDKNIIISAHGVAPDYETVLRTKSVNVIDCTCKNVKSIQLLVRKLTHNKSYVIIIGDINHSEIKGIKGYADNDYLYIADTLEKVEEYCKIIPEREIIHFVPQSTLTETYFMSIVDKIMHHHIDYKSMICASTLSRQEAVKTLATKVDVILVVGDSKSSNSMKLLETASILKPSFLIDFNNFDMTLLQKVEQYKKVGITGGASTPDWQIEWIISMIRRQKFPQISQAMYDYLKDKDFF